MVHATCAALHCLSSTTHNKELKFHQFPHDVERRNLWINACKRTDLLEKPWAFFKHQYLCSKHFPQSEYSRKKNLKKSAVPTLHLPDKPLCYEACTQTWESIQSIISYHNPKEVEKLRGELSIIYVTPDLEKLVTTSQTQTEESMIHCSKITNEIEHMPHESSFQSECSHIPTETIRKANPEIEMKKIIDEDKIAVFSIQHKESQQDYIAKTEIKVEREEIETANIQEKENVQCDKLEMKIKKAIEQGESVYEHAGEQIQSIEPEVTDSTDIDIEDEISYTMIGKTVQCDDPETDKNQSLLNIKQENILASLSASISSPHLKVDQSTQTERIIIYSLPRKRGFHIPVYCQCPRRPKMMREELDERMTLGHFLKACDKLLPQTFCSLIKNEVYLEQISKKCNLSVDTLGATKGSLKREKIDKLESMNAVLFNTIQNISSQSNNLEEKDK